MEKEGEPEENGEEEPDVRKKTQPEHDPEDAPDRAQPVKIGARGF